MKKNLTNKARAGFTLIEVVIVLAIGALIILVVLNAVGSARRSQRDSTRRSEAAQLASAVTEYASNNNQQVPVDGDLASLEPYVGDIANKYTDAAACSTMEPDVFEVIYVPGPQRYDFTMEVCLEGADGAVDITTD